MASTAFKKAPLNRPNAIGALDSATHPTGISDSATSITLNSGDGAKFPSTAPFWITFYEDDQDTNEIAEVTANPSSDTFGTISRGQQGTSAAAWGALGETVNVGMLITRDQFTDLQTAVNNVEDGTTVLASVTVDGDIIANTGNTSVDLLNTVATTINFGGAASTALNIGNASGTMTLAGGVVVSKESDGLLCGATPTTAASGGGDNVVVCATTGNMGATLISNNDSNCNIFFGDSASATSGQISYQHSGNDMIFSTSATTALTLDSSQDATFAGDVNIGGFLNLGTSVELTISSGAVTATQSYHDIDTESNDSSDDLDTINGGSEGDILYISAASASRTVVCKDATGNLNLAGDFTMNNNVDVLHLRYDEGVWKEVSRSNNGS